MCLLKIREIRKNEFREQKNFVDTRHSRCGDPSPKFDCANLSSEKSQCRADTLSLIVDDRSISSWIPINKFYRFACAQHQTERRNFALVHAPHRLSPILQTGLTYQIISPILWYSRSHLSDQPAPKYHPTETKI